MKTSLRTTLFALAAVPALLMGVAACSSASSDGKTAPSAKASATAQEWNTAFAACMRSEGLDYPDPSTGKIQPLTIDSPAEEAAYTRADATCRTKTTGRLGEQPVTDGDKKELDDYNAKQLELNKCLRGKGYDVKDPDPNGGAVSENLAARIPADALKACGYAE